MTDRGKKKWHLPMGNFEAMRSTAMLHAWKYEPNPAFPGVDIDAIHHQRETGFDSSRDCIIGASMTNSRTDEALADLLEKLAKHLRERQQELPREDVQRIYENIWPLYGPQESRPICDACRRGGVCGCYQPLWDSPVYK